MAGSSLVHPWPVIAPFDIPRRACTSDSLVNCFVIVVYRNF